MADSLTEFVNEATSSNKAPNKLATEIAASIDKIDDSMSVQDFASAVATVINENYGKHNVKHFLDVLNKQLVK